VVFRLWNVCIPFFSVASRAKPTIHIQQAVPMRLIEVTTPSRRRMGDQTTIRTGGMGMDTLGLLCNFRIGYLSGTGETVTERLEQVFVPVDGEPRTEEIDLTGSLPHRRRPNTPKSIG